ncbi:4'-phosphopantetheinyl transferase family protein [Paenibacillus sp. HW567]|uniref:4'-phosphopantetheinyl transferase family protein n=1 Tax=Paenibacillus sp. HW567 TaxID=1034769 RepID=UPI00036D2FB2|nr:4'-phosphopantetheinyl transferase superfamily protein [Paenibacillus sp. HW567]
MVRIFSVKIPKASTVNYEEVLDLLSEERRLRTLRYRRKEDRIRSVLGETLIRTLLIREHHLDNRSLRFAVNRYGKPYLADLPDCQFNLSHAGDYVMCAIDQKPLGIDVEEIKPMDLSIASRFFAPCENQEILRMPEDRRLDHFYQLWTAKESYIKFKGSGLSMPLNSFCLQISDGCIELVEQEGSPAAQAECYFKPFHISVDYKVTLCSESPNHPKEIQNIDCHELLREFRERSGPAISRK